VGKRTGSLTHQFVKGWGRMHDHEHPHPTQNSRFRYLFTAKHHGGGAPDAARWSPQLSEAEEFSVFDLADQHTLSDSRQWLYGILRGGDGLCDLGTSDQQVAEFPFANTGQPWHGYPLWPVSELGPRTRRGEKYRPERAVFDKMVAAGLITTRQRKRLLKGDHA
jgi:hypothetical protein